MIQQTKLVDCGSTIFVYDFEGRRNIQKLGFEQDSIEGNITRLKRLILTNFVNEKFLASFTLRIALNEYDELQNKLNHFINHVQRTSRHSEFKYLAVLELPSKEYESYAYIRLITGIEIYKLTSALDDELPEEDLEEYFEDSWGDMVLINVYSPRELLNVFSSAFSNSTTSTLFNGYSNILFHSQLKQPRILRNEKAHAFIEKHNLFDYPKHQSHTFYDKTVKFVIVNEYSFYDTSSFTQESD